MYRAGGIAPRAGRTCSGVGDGELTVVTEGVAGVDNGAGVGVGFCPNAEQANMKAMIVKCLAVLTNNLNEYIWVSRIRSRTAVTEGNLPGPNVWANSGTLTLERQARARLLLMSRKIMLPVSAAV